MRGGFSRDVEYRMMQDPKLTSKLDSTNQPGATSELWRETSRIGCAQIQNDWIQCTPWNNPKEKGMGIGWTFSQSAAAEYGLWVSTSGKRFVNELANRKVRADAIMVEQTNDFRAVSICTKANTKAFEDARPGMLAKLLEQGIVKEYKSLADIAADYKMPADKDGNISGGFKVKNFRPYLGIGWGRMIPGKIVNFSTELGVQFEGTPELYTDYGEIDESITEDDNTFNKVANALKVYPTLTFRINFKAF